MDAFGECGSVLARPEAVDVQGAVIVLVGAELSREVAPRAGDFDGEVGGVGVTVVHEPHAQAVGGGGVAFVAFLLPGDAEGVPVAHYGDVARQEQFAVREFEGCQVHQPAFVVETVPVRLMEEVDGAGMRRIPCRFPDGGVDMLAEIGVVTLHASEARQVALLFGSHVFFCRLPFLAGYTDAAHILFPVHDVINHVPDFSAQQSCSCYLYFHIFFVVLSVFAFTILRVKYTIIFYLIPIYLLIISLFYKNMIRS